MIRFKKIPEDIHKRIDLLTDLFMEDPNILFAYLFGGLARGRRRFLKRCRFGDIRKEYKKIKLSFVIQ